MDKEVKIQELKDLLKDFRDKRDWEQFHTPKDLAEDIVVEAGELLELFLWKDKEQVAKKIAEDPEYKQEIKDELADVIWAALSFSNVTGIDVSEALKSKMAKNHAKYPIEKAKGKALKYNKL